MDERGRNGLADGKIAHIARVVAVNCTKAHMCVDLLQGGARTGCCWRCLAGTTTTGLRTSLIDKGVLAPHGDLLVFTQDCVFDSASAPLAVIRGQASSGPGLWATAEAKTLKSFEAEQVKEAVTALPQNEADI
jgi:Domain of unknown function (DUF4357)